VTTYWHFVRSDLRLGYQDNRLVAPHTTYHADPGKKIALCQYGMHASKTILDALSYAPGLALCEVTLGPILGQEHDKVVSSSRHVLRIIPAEKVRAVLTQMVLERLVRGFYRSIAPMLRVIPARPTTLTCASVKALYINAGKGNMLTQTDCAVLENRPNVIWRRALAVGISYPEKTAWTENRLRTLLGLNEPAPVA